MNNKKKLFNFKKPTVKDWIRIGIIVILLGLLTYIVIRLIPDESPDNTLFTYYTYEEPDPLFGVPEYVIENENIRFQLDPDTTHFTVTQKNTGRVWYSNPVNAESDPRALVKEKNYMNSTLLLTYSTENGVNNTYDTSSYSVEKKYYTIEKKGKAITVNYIVGDIQRVYRIPMALVEDRMDEFLDQMKRSDSNIVKQYYRKYDIDNLNAQDDEKELLSKYPQLEEENVYEIRDGAPEYMKERIEKIFNDIGYTAEDYEKDLEMYAGGAVKNNPMFNITVVYSLEGNTLSVDIPFDKIIYKKDYPLIKLAVLPYFGAAETEDEGFIFVPEGGGAIINFNNNKNKQNSYYADVYGWDYCTDRSAVVNETRNSYPVFGMSYKDSSFISILDKGASYGGIYADVSGRYNSYNTAYASYSLVHFEQYEVSSKSNNAEFAYEKSLPEGEQILQKYEFIDSGSYTDMAHSYGEYLKKLYSLKNLKSDNIPVAVEIVGAIDKVQQIAGFPKSKPFELTSYENAGKIIDELNEMKFQNMFIKLSGDFNDGINQKNLTKFKFISELGGKKAFKKLIEGNEGRNRLYLDGQVSYARDNKLFDGFFMYSDCARFVSDEIVRLYEYSPIYYNKNAAVDYYYLVKPEFARKMAENFIAAAGKYNLTGVSFADYGEELSSDFNKERRVSREQSKQHQKEVFELAAEEGLGIMVKNGNDYALPYADCITNMDYTGTKYLIIDEQIPFYQMAIHGLVNYTGEPVNISPDANRTVLEAAAYGGGLHFVFTGKDSSAVQDTNYTQYYGAGFNTWKKQAEKIYARFNKEFGGITDKKMTNYRNITSFVSCTEYEDGTMVYVNRGNVAYKEPGLLVPPEDYVVKHETNSRGN